MRKQALKTREDYEAEAAVVEAKVVALLAQWGPPAPLSPHEERPACPKCGNLAVTIDYHASGGHDRCPERDFASLPYFAFAMNSPDTTARYIAHSRRAIEHMDRKCQNCGFGWVTDVARADHAATLSGSSNDQSTG